ncbi:60S ribosomal protein L7 [Ancylostoma duodenale]|uniref:60S ribosomal protein L7 n=1 Tax=Ancylostoma duodenale TaxID=51022 RepID=A0A0C2FJ89_9BILA|nr:60S ribosomal protein L7 [Ancylostoma duodenale]
MVEKKLPQVPETVLKRRKQRAEIRAKIIQNKVKAAAKNKEKKAKIFKRAEKYVAEYRQAQREQLRLKRDAEKKGDFYVPDEPKLAFVIRIRGINQIHPRPRKVCPFTMDFSVFFVTFHYSSTSTFVAVADRPFHLSSCEIVAATAL